MIPRTTPNRANPPSETYECFTRKQDTEACGQLPIKRAEIDRAVLAYFEQVGLDLDATRDQLRAAISRKAEEAHLLLNAARSEASAATERLARVKRDYLNNDLTAEEWRELRAELEPEAEASKAEVERLTRQLHAHEAEDALDGVEQQVADLLQNLRSAVQGSGDRKVGAAAVSATLLRLFDHFTFHTGIPEVANVELIDTDRWSEPTPRMDEAEEPGARMPLYQAENNCLKGLPFGYLAKANTKKDTTKGSAMGILDKITGKTKQAAGDLTDDASLRRQGKREERKGERKDELDHAQNKADEKAEEVADLERKT